MQNDVLVINATKIHIELIIELLEGKGGEEIKKVF